jgi:DNA-binding response OmpR family regulator
MRSPRLKLVRLADENQVTEEEPTAGQVPGKPGVLVVDDDRMVCSVLQLGLEREGFEVWMAANGRQAIDLYRRHKDSIAAVLLDVRMRGLDGPQTLDALRRLNPDVRACFMSGDTGAYTMESLLERGAAQVINKPFLLAEVANILRLLLRCTSEDLIAANAPPRCQLGSDGYQGGS